MNVVSSVPEMKWNHLGTLKIMWPKNLRYFCHRTSYNPTRYIQVGSFKHSKCKLKRYFVLCLQLRSSYNNNNNNNNNNNIIHAIRIMMMTLIKYLHLRFCLTSYIHGTMVCYLFNQNIIFISKSVCVTWLLYTRSWHNLGWELCCRKSPLLSVSYMYKFSLCVHQSLGI